MAKQATKRRKTVETKEQVRQTAQAEPPRRLVLRYFPDWRNIAGAFAIAAIVLWIYWPVLHGGWLWDDDYLIENNGLIHDTAGLWNIWFAPQYLIDYFPLTVSIEWLEWQLWPDSTFCYHVTNVIFHTLSCLLFWRLLTKLGVRLAWLGGVLFAVHPMTVESVAWMAELKNTLSMPPFLLAMCAWIDFEKRGRDDDYLLAFVWFLVAMLCKTAMLMFPVMTVVYAWYLRDRIAWRDITRTIPFLVVSALMIALVIAFRRIGVGEETIPLGGVVSRVAVTGLSIAFYFSKSFVPLFLSPLYPQWPVNPPSPLQFLPWIVMAVLAYFLWTKRATWGRPALLGLSFFVIYLLPFGGIHPIAFMRFGWTMDHILYIPLLGLIGLIAAGVGGIEAQLPPLWRGGFWTGAVAILAVFMIGSRQYAETYESSTTLWTYTIHRYPDGWLAYNNLGDELASNGRQEEAKDAYLNALRLNPTYPEAHNNVGIIYFKEGHLDRALAEFSEALRLCPDLENAKKNLATLQAFQLQQSKSRAGASN